MTQILYTILLLIFNPAHEFHMSKTDIHYKSDQKSIQFSVFLFIDDFEETVLLQQDSTELKLFTDQESASSDSIIYNYISDRLSIEVDDHIISPDYIGKELDEKDLQGMWIYLEVNDQNTFSTMSVSNSLLTESFSDQRNIINVLVDKKRIAYHILDKDDYLKEINI